MGLLRKTPLSWLARAGRALERAREDVEAFCANDPAARSGWEVLLLYPGLHALWLHRVAHELWDGERPFSARLVSHMNRFVTGIEIHPAARVGRRVVIDHGMGIVVGETATIGDGCLLYKGVVLGGTTLSHGKRHPQLGEGVVVGSNACILGYIMVGDGARVGSGSVVVKPVAAHATVVGVPARVIVPSGLRFDAALDHANLPNPVTDMIRALAKNGGVMDINFYSGFLSQAFQDGYGKIEKQFEAALAAARAQSAKQGKRLSYLEEVRIEQRLIKDLPVPSYTAIADHIDHAVKVGGIDHVGLGSDFDGVDSAPRGMEDVSKIPNLVIELARRGYSEEDLEKILGGNVLRVMRQVEQVARQMQTPH